MYSGVCRAVPARDEILHPAQAGAVRGIVENAQNVLTLHLGRLPPPHRFIGVPLLLGCGLTVPTGQKRIGRRQRVLFVKRRRRVPWEPPRQTVGDAGSDPAGVELKVPVAFGCGHRNEHWAGMGGAQMQQGERLAVERDALLGVGGEAKIFACELRRQIRAEPCRLLAKCGGLVCANHVLPWPRAGEPTGEVVRKLESNSGRSASPSGEKSVEAAAGSLDMRDPR